MSPGFLRFICCKMRLLPNNERRPYKGRQYWVALDYLITWQGRFRHGLGAMLVRIQAIGD
jgi:hypothetical protein